MTIDHQLETMMRAVVDDITHEKPLMRENQFFARACGGQS